MFRLNSIFSNCPGQIFLFTRQSSRLILREDTNVVMFTSHAHDLCLWLFDLCTPTCALYFLTCALFYFNSECSQQINIKFSLRITIYTMSFLERQRFFKRYR